jgi:hypothetical protein
MAITAKRNLSEVESLALALSAPLCIVQENEIWQKVHRG